MNEWALLAFGLVLTVGTGFFVASEFSLLNVERNDLESQKSRGQKGLDVAIKALKATSTHLSAAQLGITVTTLLTGFVAEPALFRRVQEAKRKSDPRTNARTYLFARRRF